VTKVISYTDKIVIFYLSKARWVTKPMKMLQILKIADISLSTIEEPSLPISWSKKGPDYISTEILSSLDKLQSLGLLYKSQKGYDLKGSMPVSLDKPHELAITSAINMYGHIIKFSRLRDVVSKHTPQ
jgi:hypothetical protein